MSTTGLKVVIDTNVFLTILSKKGKNRWIFDKIIKGEFILCISNDILMEYWEVVSNKTNPDVALNVTNFLLIHPHIKLVNVYINWNLVEVDADDNKFADCYLAANARYLISNDNHLLSLKSVGFPKINVVSSKEINALR